MMCGSVWPSHVCEWVPRCSGGALVCEGIDAAMCVCVVGVAPHTAQVGGMPSAIVCAHFMCGNGAPSDMAVL